MLEAQQKNLAFEEVLEKPATAIKLAEDLWQSAATKNPKAIAATARSFLEFLSSRKRVVFRKNTTILSINFTFLETLGRKAPTKILQNCLE